MALDDLERRRIERSLQAGVKDALDIAQSLDGPVGDREKALVIRAMVAAQLAHYVRNGVDRDAVGEGQIFGLAELLRQFGVSEEAMLQTYRRATRALVEVAREEETRATGRASEPHWFRLRRDGVIRFVAELLGITKYEGRLFLTIDEVFCLAQMPYDTLAELGPSALCEIYAAIDRYDPVAVTFIPAAHRERAVAEAGWKPSQDD